MLLLTCSTLVAPCPIADQVWVASEAISSAADIGITPELIATVISWGFGVVLLGWVLGYGLGVTVGIIKKL